jgi:hypothetical protein
MHDESIKSRQHLMENIFDWMMEVASHIKITKNAYYRAILMLQIASRLDSRLIASKRINDFACAALSIGSKYEGSRSYLDEIYLLNSRRVSKIEMINAENCILKVYISL